MSKQRASLASGTWNASRKLGPRARRGLRGLADAVLRPIGSINGITGTTCREYALTFDDGPDPRSTPDVLEALAAHGVQATFFMLVDRAEAAPEIVESVVSHGHEIALHGNDHRRLTDLPTGEIRTRISEGRSRLEFLAGTRILWFRPPYGAQSPKTWFAARRSGLEVVVWSADIEDWTGATPEYCSDLAQARTTPGGILLMHDTNADRPAGSSHQRSDRAAIVDAVLSRLDTQSLRPVPVGTLLSTGRWRRTAWFRP